MVTLLATLVLLFSVIRTLPRRWQKYRPKHVGENIVNKMHHKYWSAFVCFIYFGSSRMLYCVVGQTVLDM